MKWISVHESLPDEKINPVTSNYYQYPVKVCIGGTHDIKYYHFGDGHWWHGPSIVDEYVTHWFDIFNI